MSKTWPSKDTDETLNYSIDWSRFMGTDTLSSVLWFVDDSDGVKTSITAPQTTNGITIDATSSTSTVTTIQLSSGTNNKKYRFYCQITFSVSGLVAERSVFLTIKDK